ncbi:glycosyl hydrolase, partial [candidate division KSB1 bacterium]|nr:glycosyl hydrolase [candidate division KSB1 bacterium]
VTYNGGEGWSTYHNQPTAQFYRVTTDHHFPYRIYGAQQDNSTVRILHRSSDGTIGARDWEPSAGGESGWLAIHAEDQDIVYGGSYDGFLTRVNHKTGERRGVNVWPDNPMGWGAADLKYRFQWTAPIMVSQHDPTKLYHAANVLFRSTDEGKSWTQISGDLTRNDKSKQGPSGGPLTHDNTSVEYYCTIFSLEESPLREGVIWVGSDDGLVHISLDDGKTWTNVTPPQMPEWGLISSIDASNHEVGTAYIAVDRHELDDHSAYAFKTTDYGKTWTAINRGFRDGDFLRVIREDETVPGILYAGTETGVYYSVDDGGSWHSLQLDLPTVPVHDLAVKRNDLIAGTHGRSFWILDDLTIIHQLKDNQSTSENRLLKPRETIRWAGGNQNRVTFNYFIANASEAEVSFEILDSNGEVIRNYQNSGSVGGGRSGRQRIADTQGWNNFNWNLQYPGARTVQGHPMWAASTAGPTAVPGNYKARLNVGGWNQTVDFTINIDPRMGSTVGQLQQQFDLLIQIRDEVSKAHDTVNQLRMIKTDLEELKKQAESVSSSRSLINKIDDVFSKLSGIEENILQVKSQSGQDPLNFPIKVNNKLAAMTGVASRNYFAPTEQTYEVVEMLSEELNGYVENYNGVIETDIEDLNRMARSANLPPIVIKSPVGN